MHIHFVIPAFRESERLPAYLDKLLFAIKESELNITLQVVDDGSGSSETKKLCSLLSPMSKQHLFLMPVHCLDKNLGKGGAVYCGWNEAPDCDVLGFVDADGSIPATELIRLSQIASHTPGSALIGSRILMLGKQVERTALRHYIGRVYATIAGTLLKLPVYDSQCGIKLVPSAVYKELADECCEYGFAFDMELLLLLNRHHCLTCEEPIDWFDIPGSKVSIIKDSIKMFLALLRLRDRFIVPR